MPGAASGHRPQTALVGFLIGAAAMFAAMYSTQAILPELGRDFHVRPSVAGLTISVVVLSVAVSALVWGPLSDRIGRKRSIVLASALLVAPTIGAALAPTFGVLLACRALQGFCMPGLLAVGLPYVTEALVPAIGGQAMGYFVSSLIAGGLIGRIGVALLTAAVGWRWAIGSLAALSLGAAALMQRALVDLPLPERSAGRLRGARRQLHNRRLLRTAVIGTTFFFAFVGVFSYAPFRLERPPFELGTATSSLIFLFWLAGVATPLVGRLSDRVGWQRLALAALALAACAIALTLASALPVVLLGLGLLALANFGGVTAAQVGVSKASDVDRGAASAVYFCIYYALGSLAAFVPGLAWQAWRWNGVALLELCVIGGVGLLLAVERRPR